MIQTAKDKGSLNEVEMKGGREGRGQSGNRDQGQVEVLLSRSPTEERQLMRTNLAAA